MLTLVKVEVVDARQTYRNCNEHPHCDAFEEETAFSSDESSYDLAI